MNPLQSPGPSARGPAPLGRRLDLFRALLLVLLVVLVGPTRASWASGLTLPAQVQAGARFVYESGSATQADFNKPASAGIGLTRYEVMAVTVDKLLLRAGNFLSDGRGYSFFGGSVLTVDALGMKTGASIWIDPTSLAGFKTDARTTVSDIAWQAAGRDWEARSLVHLSSDSASRQVFDRSTGLLLAHQLASGQQRPGMTDPFMKQNTSSMAYQGHRQVDLPWAGGADPEWTRTVRRLVYQGQQVYQGLGVGPAIATPLRHRIEISERGEGWAIGTVTVEMQGQPDNALVTGTGPGGLGALWVDPAKMASLPAGVIDRDPTLGTTLSFERSSGPQGRRRRGPREREQPPADLGLQPAGWRADLRLVRAEQHGREDRAQPQRARVGLPP